MAVRVLPAAVCVALAAWAGSAVAAAAPSAQVIDGSFRSRAVSGTLHYAVALPPGYSSGNTRYPVVYFLHGLPAGPKAYRGIAALADSLARTGHQAIVVGAQGARAGDTDPEWHDWGPGRDWETATASELVRWIDNHYRTIAQRSGRAIVGVSGGGYGAMLIGIHHPAIYSVIESWSGYFYPTDPSGKPLALDTPNARVDANAHFAVASLARRFSPYGPTFFGFFIGNRDPYPGFVQDNVRLDRELTAAGFPHRFAIYQGAHNQAFWSLHQDEWLAAAVNRLAKPTPR